MIVLDQHKEELLQAINQKIYALDYESNILTNKIYDYSEEKKEQLNEILLKKR